MAGRGGEESVHVRRRIGQKGGPWLGCPSPSPPPPFALLRNGGPACACMGAAETHVPGGARDAAAGMGQKNRQKF